MRRISKIPLPELTVYDTFEGSYKKLNRMINNLNKAIDEMNNLVSDLNKNFIIRSRTPEFPVKTCRNCGHTE